MSPGSIVLLPGIVHGMEREAECEVLARRSLSTAAVHYAECSVITAPPDLPDGNYGIIFDGHFVVASKKKGLWVTQSAVTRVE